MIANLKALRGPFIFCIYLSHYNVQGKPLLGLGGDMGVAFFFMLSGFVMCVGYFDKFADNKICFSVYLRRRLIRIYPLHLLCFLVALQLCRFNIEGNWLPWVFNLFLIQSWIPESTFYFSANAVSWFLSDLLFFYALFPLLAKLLKSNKWIFFSIPVLWGIFNPFVPEELWNALIYINPLSRIMDCMLGMGIWRLSLSLKERGNISVGYTVSQTISFVILLAACLLYNHVPECFRLQTLWWPAVACILLSFSIANGSYITNPLYKCLLWFGDISFTFFLIHTEGITICSIALSKINLPLPEPARFLIITSAIVVASKFLTVYFVNPISRKRPGIH